MSSVRRRSARPPAGGGVPSRSRRATRTQSKVAAPSKGFVFKVALKGSPGTWRRIAVRGDQTLHRVHAGIFAAFDREEEHLYSFYFPKAGARGHARLPTAVEYTHPFAAESDPFGETHPDASKARLDRLGLRVGQKFEYLFDFGDSWWHEITVEAVAALRSAGAPVSLLERRGASPAQYPDADSAD